MPITITMTDPQDHAPYELRVLGEYFQALANYKRVAKTANAGPAEPMYSLSALKAAQETSAVAAEYKRTVHDEELLSDEERAMLRDTIAEAGLEESANEAIAGTSKALREERYARTVEAVKTALENGQGVRIEAGSLRGTAGGDQDPYSALTCGSDDFAELRDDPKPDASTGAAASDGKTAQAASTPSLDSAGMPWDERIHSGSKSVNADGTWRYKRGGDLAERDRVEKELLGNAVGSEANTPATASASETAGTPGADDDIPPPPVEDDVPPPPAEEDDVPPPPVEEVNSGMVFRAITAGQKGSLTQEAIMASLQAVGLTSTIDILKADQSVLVPLLALIEEASK